MKYERNVIVSNLYETSKSKKGGSLLSADAGKYEVYDLDQVKDEFCRYYRHDEIEIKIIDTHMILNETFCRNKKCADLAKKLNMLLVYNDALNYGKGVCQIQNALNTMAPRRGDAARNVKTAQTYADDSEFLEAVGETKKKYEGQFYREIRFVEKKDFEADYVETEYFGNLTEWPEISG